MLSRPTAISEPLAAGWLAAIVESSDDAIISKTLDGIITSWNPAAERLFGYTAEEMIGGPIAILAAPDRENEMPAILESIRRGEKVDHYETVRRRKDGSLVEISLTVSPIRDETGRIIGASKIARDITARKQIEDRQRMLTAELSHRVKNLFAVVRVLAERSASKATSAAECIEAFRSRLRALNAAHNALIAEDWHWASLASLVQTALEPYLVESDRTASMSATCGSIRILRSRSPSGSTSWLPTPPNTARLPVRPAGSRSRRASRRVRAATSSAWYGRRMADQRWTPQQSLVSALACSARPSSTSTRARSSWTGASRA
jgi:PAS domain S-box-containing protein